MRQAAYIHGVIHAAVRRLHKSHVPDDIIDSYLVDVDTSQRIDVSSVIPRLTPPLDKDQDMLCTMVAVGHAYLEKHQKDSAVAHVLAREFTRLEKACLHGQRSEGANKGHRCNNEARQIACELALKLRVEQPALGLVEMTLTITRELERLDLRNRSNDHFRESTIRNWIRHIANETVSDPETAKVAKRRKRSV